MYRSHFGLTQLPFKNSPDFHFFYEQASRLEILNALIYVVKRGDAIVKVTGEVGCGKTTILRLLAGSLGDSFKIVYINSPNLNARDLLFHIADELSISPDPGLAKFSLLKLLRDELLNLHSQGLQVVILVDEAQAMSVDTLEEIRLLSNIETEHDKLVQIVLFGQPELDHALQQHNLRQLKDRISYHIHVPPLTPEEVQSYLNYRMRQASYKGLDYFNPRFSRLIHKLSSGLPRSINTIADQLLMSAFGMGDVELKKRHFKNISSENISKVQINFKLISLAILVVLIVSYVVIFRFQDALVSHFSSTDSVRYHDVTSIAPKHSAQTLQKPNVNLVDQAIEIESASLSGEHENEESIVIPEVNKSTDKLYQILKSTGLKEEQVSDLMRRHYKTAEWLLAHPSSNYVIQLSVASVSDFVKAIESYERYKIPDDELYVMVDLNISAKKYRVKFLYLKSESYSYLKEKLIDLPSALKKSQPFITPLKQLLHSLERTKQALS
ncbi:ExeA family protein [Thiomicrorhabdus chilensis]|uniref:ExeA family protein n=1 Tax=Thiomicrorhabdus chilensis TaxID=63656 RepID=UPI00040FE65F|nr:AAA family ATPase [Thiomicrorhabdus chilensis]